MSGKLHKKKDKQIQNTHCLLPKDTLLAKQRNFTSLFEQAPIHFEVPSSFVNGRSQVRYQPQDFPSAKVTRFCNYFKGKQNEKKKGTWKKTERHKRSSLVSMESAKAKHNMSKCDAYLPALVKLGCTCPLSLYRRIHCQKRAQNGNEVNMGAATANPLLVQKL